MMRVIMEYFKIRIFLPDEKLSIMMTEINKTIPSIYPNYDYVFNYSDVIGTWRPLKNAKPFKGKHHRIEKTKEKCLEFAIEKKYIENAIKIIKEIHPYEEPAIEIYPFHNYRVWKKLN